MEKEQDLTKGTIWKALLNFSIPIFFTLFLQALYGGIDLLIVGQFATTEDVSGVATGSILLATITTVITALTLGITILVAQNIGSKNFLAVSKVIGSGIWFFGIVSILLTITLTLGADFFTKLLHAPVEAFDETASYIKICGMGSLFVVSYNLLGAIFRGLGDSKTPLLTVAIATIINILGDIILIIYFNLGANGAALATVFAQMLSVMLSIMFIKLKNYSISFSVHDIKYTKEYVAEELRLGTPVALQEFLVGISFLVIQLIVNALGVIPSAAVGVAEKIVTFMMLIPSAYMHSICAFVAQNLGAGNRQRATKALYYGICSSLCLGVIMFYLNFFHGDMVSSIFTQNTAVIIAAHSYLKAYAIDSCLTPFLFCFIGYFNGCSQTYFVMVQGIIGAFLVRVPIAFYMSSLPEPSLFQIGLSTPASTLVQIILCVWIFRKLQKNYSS